MRRKWQSFVFIVVSLAINTCFFGLFTVNGYNYIYNVGMNISSRMVDVNDESFVEYKVFDGQLKKNMVFIFENEPDSVTKVDLFIDFIKYLNEKNDVKYIFDEIGYASGQLINSYLQTGDESFLDMVFESTTDFELYTLYRKSYYKKLHDYNFTLPQSDRIKLFGLDTESGDKQHSLIYLDHLLNKIEGKTIPSKINDILYADRENVDSYFRNVNESLEQNDAMYKELFVEDYHHFSLLIENYFTDKSNDNIRFQRMAVNFIKLYDMNIRGKYFGVFSDTVFIEKILSIYGEVQNRIIVYNIYNNLLFDAADKHHNVYTINNRILKYFVNYRKFVYKINRQTITDSMAYNDDAFFILNK